MHLKKSLRFLAILFLGFSLSLVSCEEDEEEEQEVPQIDRGHTEVNRMKLTFSRIVGGVRVIEDSAEVNLATGEVDSLIIPRYNSSNNPITYEGVIRFFLDGSEVTGIIKDKDFDYIVCYRDFQTQQLLLRTRDQDSDGRLLGLNTEWTTIRSDINRNETIRITLNYQPLMKEGLCDAGIRIFEYNLPYRYE